MGKRVEIIYTCEMPGCEKNYVIDSAMERRLDPNIEYKWAPRQYAFRKEDVIGHTERDQLSLCPIEWIYLCPQCYEKWVETLKTMLKPFNEAIGDFFTF